MFKAFSGTLDVPGASEIDIRRGQIVQRLVDTLFVVVPHETGNLALELPRRVVILQLDDVLHRPVVALDLALRHRVIRFTARVLQGVLPQVILQLLRNEAGTVVGQKPRPVPDLDLRDTRLRQGVVEHRLHVARRHPSLQLPRNDVATVVVQDGQQVVPAPAHHLQVREVGLPQLVHSASWPLKTILR